jgi:hypothetical protein
MPAWQDQGPEYNLQHHQKKKKKKKKKSTSLVQESHKNLLRVIFHSYLLLGGKVRQWVFRE